MAAILFGIYKDVHITEHEFYEPREMKYFWVHKIVPDEIELEALVRSIALFLLLHFHYI